MTAKLYLQKWALDETHWGKRIIKAEQKGSFTSKDKDDASNWMSCACGKLDKRIPRTRVACRAPDDSKLTASGYKFSDSINHNEFWAAAYLLSVIEERGNEILAIQKAERERRKK